jgi:hypothetical protein
MTTFKLITLLIISFMVNTLLAQSHAEDVCSNSKNVCAHYESQKPFVVSEEGRFELHLESPSNEAILVENYLWMQMGSSGHRSSPLKVTQISPGIYDITKAYFVMKGLWEIKVSYQFHDEVGTLSIPVLIK